MTRLVSIEGTDSQHPFAAILSLLAIVILPGPIALMSIVRGEPVASGQHFVWVASIGTTVFLFLYALLLDRNPGLTEELLLHSNIRDIQFRIRPGSAMSNRYRLCVLAAYVWSFAWLAMFYVALDQSAIVGVLSWFLGPISVIVLWRFFNMSDGAQSPSSGLVAPLLPQAVLLGGWLVLIFVTANSETWVKSLVLALIGGGAIATNWVLRRR